MESQAQRLFGILGFFACRVIAFVQWYVLQVRRAPELVILKLAGVIREVASQLFASHRIAIGRVAARKSKSHVVRMRSKIGLFSYSQSRGGRRRILLLVRGASVGHRAFCEFSRRRVRSPGCHPRALGRISGLAEALCAGGRIWRYCCTIVRLSSGCLCHVRSFVQSRVVDMATLRNSLGVERDASLRSFLFLRCVPCFVREKGSLSGWYRSESLQNRADFSVDKNVGLQGERLGRKLALLCSATLRHLARSAVVNLVRIFGRYLDILPIRRFLGGSRPFGFHSLSEVCSRTHTVCNSSKSEVINAGNSILSQCAPW